MSKLLILDNLEEVLRRKLSTQLPYNISNAITLEEWLRRATDYIKELEKDSSAALRLEYTKKINYLERLNSENNDKYIEREKGYWKIMADLRKRLQETYDKLPVEERMKQDFTCYTCSLVWDREFLTMTDKQGNSYCWSCIEEGTQKAGENIGREIIVDSTPRSKPVVTYTCEVCNLRSLNKINLCHITNSPDGRSSRKITRVCDNCLHTKAKLDINIDYCPLRTGPRDSYDLPEYDCDCAPTR